ncbi:uncharacterized protein LTR77_002113 [Saxophila tyrrhenica]|uniref:Thioesterase-like superfamily-domain-containing protein n=1 Tax=Saxophila tyrrhenica TaxID=1690608 RepID=A0AAV9PI17_9PEZI|nr:hypothetical protein LTR77_002113 [Saxophila tyrrhenica]
MSENSIIQNALKIERQRPNAYTAKIGQDQRFGEFLHGGFAASLLVYTALEHAKTTLGKTKEQQVISCQAQYLKPVNKSELQLQVEHLRVGKANASLRVVLSQKGSPSVTGDVNLVDATANRGVTADVAFSLNPPHQPADLTKLESNTDPNWVLYHLPYSEKSQGQPLSHWNLFFTRSGPVNPRLHDMWCTLNNPNARITNAILPTLADSYLRQADNFTPNSDFSYSAVVARAERSVAGDIRQDDLDKTVTRFWTATQSLSLEIVKQLPKEGVKWMLMRAEAKAIQDGRLIVEVTLMNEKMELVGYGKGVDILIPAQRWVEESRREGGGARMMKI